MKLWELFKFIGSEQMVELVIDKWRITATADALDCCLNDDAGESDVKSIDAEDDTLVVVCASCAEEEHDGCEGCKYEKLEECDEPCAHCRGTAGAPAVYMARRDYYEPKEGK